MQPEPSAATSGPHRPGPPRDGADDAAALDGPPTGEEALVDAGTPTPGGDGPRLGVAAVARRLGIAPATLRTWDRRYGIGPTDHAPGRHRRYSTGDMARLELMQHALVRGAGPAEAARYALDARLPRPDADPPDRPRALVPPGGRSADDDLGGIGPTGAADPDGSIPDGDGGPDVEGGPLLAPADGIGEPGARVRVGGRVLRLAGAGPRARDLGRAALALDDSEARTLLVESIAAQGVQATWDDVARPVLAAVAQRWAYTGAGIEIEHMLSECVIRVFGTHATTVPLASGLRPVLLAGMPEEQHTLPLVVLAAALGERHVPSRSLGSNLPVAALASAIRRNAPVAVVLWSQMPATADPGVLRLLPRTRPRFRMFVAGPGWDGVDLPMRTVRLESLAGATEAISAASPA